jgi:radical SAM superfamily enzyme YgiQ (UPF0313 family)
LSKRSIIWEEIQRARQRLAAETGAIIKDWGGKLPFDFVYPNSYYIGMSNLGLQVIYGWLNNREDCLCERTFWEKENRDKGSVPLSIESQRPLNDFAIVAFSLNYEIDYFNIVPILKASGLPVHSNERDESHPLIIAGGPCVSANPMPVAPFFDCLCIGEAEAVLPSLLPVLAANISRKRDELLKLLSGIPGVYVPLIHPDMPVTRQWVRDLDDFAVHSIVLTPNTELGDMYLIEVERGCAHGCRFCLVSNTFSPMRFHSLHNLLEQARQGLRYRKRIGLVGPAVTDHPEIEKLLSGLLEKSARISISSLRTSSLTPEILGMMAQGGLRSIALAPEAGSQCLRNTIKKGINEDQVLQAIDVASQKGLQQIKLYFMIGLPRETEKDIEAIVDLTLAAKNRIDHIRGKTRLTLNISPFVPKAGTPFQWLPMESVDILSQRIGILKNRLSRQGIQVKAESPQWSEIQAVLSRGNLDLAGALADVESESLPAWRRAIEKHSIDIDMFAHQQWPLNRRLPWVNIESETKPEKLKNEYHQAFGNT